MTELTVSVKVEPPEDTDATSGYFSYENRSNGEMLSEPCARIGSVTDHAATGVSPRRENGTSEMEKYHDKRNFTCLLCDAMCDSRDGLRRHLRTAHASNNIFSLPSQNNSVLNNGIGDGNEHYHYVCTICGANFKTYRLFLTHSMSHKGIGSLSFQYNQARKMAVLSKQPLQEYFEADDAATSCGQFTCDECKTTFLQRDSYAMHRMMRAMNESCQSISYQAMDMGTSVISDSSDASGESSSEITSGLNKVRSQDSDVMSVPGQQRCLEDVTGQVEQDEYLKSVLEKVCVASEHNVMDSRKPSYRDTSGTGFSGNVCAFCGASFVDADTLAMHVMSDHADEMSLPTQKFKYREPKPNYLQWIGGSSVSEMFNFCCKFCGDKFNSRDNLAMHVLSHTQRELVNRSPLVSNCAVKRPHDHELNSETSRSLPRMKISRTIGRYNHTSWMASPVPLQSRDTAVRSSTNKQDLVCEKCHIRFYSQNEYNSHNQQNHRSSDETNRNEPLCLKTSKVVDSASDVNLSVPSQNKYAMKRSNSFCVDEESRRQHVTNTAPTRPQSASIPTLSAIKSDTTFSKSTDITGILNHEKGLGEQSCENINSKAKSSIEALSSHEKRIFYSIFGQNAFEQPTRAEYTGQTVHENKNTNTHGPTDQERRLSGEKCEPHNEIIRHKLSPRESISCSNNNNSDNMAPKVAKQGSTIDMNANENEGRNPNQNAAMCKFCDIIFMNNAIYYLHMGLHNVNNPWQCNVCGKLCKNAVDFAAHVIHM